MMNTDSPKNTNQNENPTSYPWLNVPQKLFTPPPPPLSTKDDGSSVDIYVTEALSSYKNMYTTVWDEMFENVKAPMCDDMSSYFFNPLKPILPLGGFEDATNFIGLSSLVCNNNNSPKLLDSPPIVGGEVDNLMVVTLPLPTLPSTKNHDVEIANSTLVALDASNRPIEIQQLINESSEFDTLALLEQEATTSQPTEEGKILKQTTIIVGHEEDVAGKIVTFAKENEIVWISGIGGSLSLIQLRRQEDVVTFQGHFDIISLGGYFTAPENDGDPMTGQISITFVRRSDGHVFGGVVHGRLIAQSTVQVTIFSLNSVEDDHEEHLED